MDSLIGLVVMAAVPVYPLVQLYAWKRTRGGWRYAATAPLLVMLPIAVLTVIAFAQQSNLWPLLLIFGSLASTIYLVAVLVLRRHLSS